jgi:uncharacterized protein (TIGR02246 family)
MASHEVVMHHHGMAASVETEKVFYQRGSPMKLKTILIATACLAVTQATRAAHSDGNEDDKAALRKNGEAFAVAFHNGDARGVAAFWAPDGDYTDLAGRHLKGRENIEKAFERLFAEQKGLNVSIDSQSLRFVTPDVAIEDGVSEVFSADGTPPSKARYTIVHVKKDGQWQLSSVRESPYAPPSNHSRLRPLEWALGEWASEGENGKPVERLSCSLTDDDNFMVTTFLTTVRDTTVGKATQWIGWDPVAKHLRSWLFDATGGFGDGAITRDGQDWVIKTNTVMRNGKKATATYVLTPVDADSFTLQARERTEDGNSLPDMPAVTMKRVK